MNIIYIKKECLFVVDRNRLNDTNVNLSLFFSSSKNSLVYINDENGQLLGYIDHRLLKNHSNSSEYIITQFREILLEGNYLTSKVDELFDRIPNLEAIPVVDKCSHLMGAYVKTVSDELSSNERVMNTIALSILPAFVEEFRLFLLQKKITTLFLLSSDEDYKEVNSLIGCDIDVRRFCGEISDKDCSLIIDMLYSRSYRIIFSKEIGCNTISLEDLLAQTLLPIAINYVKNKGAKLIFVEGPLKERISSSMLRWPQIYRNITLPEAVNDKYLLRVFCNEDASLIEWSQNPSEGILAGDVVCTNGIHLLMSNNLNVNDTEKTCTCVYIYGPCFSYGACVPPKYRISSLLEQLRPEYRIVNNGVKNGRSILNDILYILDTPVKYGDVLIDINAYSSTIKEIINCYEDIFDFNDYLNLNINERCQFLDNTFHANTEVTLIAAQYLATLIPNLICAQNGSRVNYLQENNKIAKIKKHKILGKSLMNSYIEYINKHKVDTPKNQVVGSVILTANPVTKGHEYLIKVAKSKCDLLYVFIVEEDSFEFSTIERMELVRAIIDDSNIVVLSTGKVMTARYTFPDYFQKSHTNVHTEISPMSDLHFYLFGAVVAPILGITKRFIGEEKKGSVTDYYNKKLQSILPSYKIDVEIIPRLCDGKNSAISATTVREMIANCNYDGLSDFLSPYVLKYILNTRSEILIRDGRWSSTYKKGERMLKKYKFFVPEAAEREAKASNYARKAGIMTPTHLITKVYKDHVVNEFEYMEMSPIDSKTINGEKYLWTQILYLISKLEDVRWEENDNYWYSHQIPEFKNALSHLKVDNSVYIAFLESLKANVFIHGDLTFDNLAISNGNLIIYDFQHGSLGPTGWDKAYLASSILYSECKLDLNEAELKMAETIAAIRYGRALRKCFEINNRKLLFESWVKR